MAEGSRTDQGGARPRVLVLFGGRSEEHEISCLSARGVLWAIDQDRYDVVSVGLTRSGRWTLVDGVQRTREGTLPSVPEGGDTIALVRTRRGPRIVGVGADDRVVDHGPVDICFPVLHGPYGEDGTVQGLLASLGVPYVGADVASSALAMDKGHMKHVFTACGLPQVAYRSVAHADWQADRDAQLDRLATELGYPMFTKPSRQGSSIGISKVTNADELAAGIDEAMTHDRVSIVEEGLVSCRELECGVIGNDDIEVTRPCETRHAGPSFYDFDAKYLAPVQIDCPADVSPDVQERCIAFARQAYQAVGARGMARVDFFYLEAEDRILVNEINTIPGLTLQSGFPPAWAAEGLDFRALVGRLLELASEAATPGAKFPP